MLHRERTHPEPVDGCERCKWTGITFAAGLTRTLAEQQKNVELKHYREERKAGSQPDGTRMPEVVKAMQEADRLGRPYRADDLSQTYHPELKKELKNVLPVTKEPTP